jgi:anaerobic magnesium-protoporphyrin IX monomethyl ester cyclase
MTQLRVALLNPPPYLGEKYIREGRCMQSVDSWATPWPPLSLAILAAQAREAGHQVDLLDANVEDPGFGIPETVARVAGFNPDLVVVNTAFPSIEGDMETAAAIKAACPSARMVGFGLFFTLLDEEAMHACPVVDYGITGEPEATFQALLERLAASKDPAGMRGLLWREGDQVRKGEPRPYIEDLDTLPLPARDLLRGERYRMPHNGRRYTLVNVARGCPYPCTYCIAPFFYGKKHRRHSVAYLMDEMDRCQQELGITGFLFWEEIFTLDRPFVVKLCEAIIERGWDIEWASTTRADRLDPELLRLMRRAGCTLMGLGIETCQQEILDSTGKAITVAAVGEGVRMMRAAGIKVMGHFMVGLPGETDETIDQTIRYAKGLGLDYLQVYAAVPWPKTSFGEQARERGWITANAWSEYDTGGRSIVEVPSISSAQVDRARERLYRAFYLRPGYVARQALGLLRHPRQIKQAVRFLQWIKHKDDRAAAE